MKKKAKQQAMTVPLCRDSDVRDRSFDLRFWSEVDDETKFEAAWQLVQDAWRIKGKKESELGFSRSFAMLKFI
jgi:hypothetical protein